MDADLKWLTGIAATLCVAFTTSLIATFRNFANKLSSHSDKVHNRIDKVKEDYVRRDDLNNHIDRIEENIKTLRKETNDNHQKLLEAILSIKK